MIDLYLMLSLSFGSILAIAVVGFVIAVVTDPRRRRQPDRETSLPHGVAGSAE